MHSDRGEEVDCFSNMIDLIYGIIAITTEGAPSGMQAQGAIKASYWRASAILPGNTSQTLSLLHTTINGGILSFSSEGRRFANIEKRVVSVFANARWMLSSKSEGVKSPSEAVKVRGFADFRESRVSGGSQTARQRGDLRSISGRKGNKKGNSSELPEMSWWSKRDSNSRPSHCQCDALAN